MKKMNDIATQSLNGFYIGKVVNRDDPEKCGRLKIRVFGLHDNKIEISKLPWFYPSFPITAPQLIGQGDSGIPEIDSTVICGFISGNVLQGFYFGVLSGTGDIPNPDDYTQDHRQIKTKTGHIIDIDPIGIKITHSDTKTHIELKENTINISTVNGDINIKAKNVNVTASDKVDIDAKKVEIKDSTNTGNIIINSSKFLKYFKQHQHPSGTGPTGPVLPGSGLETGQDWFTKTVEID